MYLITFDNYPDARVDADALDIDPSAGWVHFLKDGVAVKSVREANVVAIDKIEGDR